MSEIYNRTVNWHMPLRDRARRFAALLDVSEEKVIVDARHGIILNPDQAAMVLDIIGAVHCPSCDCVELPVPVEVPEQ
jgi:hypothetical protein